MSALSPTSTVHVPDAAKAAASAALRAGMDTARVLPDIDVRPYLDHGARQLRAHLPAGVLQALARWRETRLPWLTLTNLPETEPAVPTPRDGFCDESLLRIPNLVQFGLLSLLGLTPVAYVWENRGLLIRNVAPRPEAACTGTSWGHAIPLDWHTDDSVLDHRTGAPAEAAIPHFLSFYGMRNTERVPTDLLPVDTLLAALPERVADELRRPQFAVTAPDSYSPGGDGTLPACTGVPVLWTLRDGRPAARYGPGRVRGLTPWARAALAWLEACLADLEGVPVMIEAGAFHIIDNRRVMHRRVPFEPAGPGRGRWLRRCYAQAGPVAAA
jgi:hypothetical protein